MVTALTELFSTTIGVVEKSVCTVGHLVGSAEILSAEVEANASASAKVSEVKRSLRLEAIESLAKDKALKNKLKKEMEEALLLELSS